MKITDMTNLWVATFINHDFTVLICAIDIQEAGDIAREYACDSGFDNEFEVKKFASSTTHFDCDYVLTYSGR